MWSRRHDSAPIANAALGLRPTYTALAGRPERSHDERMTTTTDHASGRPRARIRQHRATTSSSREGTEGGDSEDSGDWNETSMDR
jgi:hypothetical protein